ncbi:Aste57867_12587 [Aphanomyces stellatus]|uniref:Aste57867_12587 protein n=1 Tax=Aphanomyces stellatus TaxID=120398 RepID=A0A485KWB8_9STRA|nr:hypothetical protein As57867_012541 [Aphanomyces stellatus]VFT89438.1 Aste57867_12587 [Aphanomyces stellatus]
MRGEKRKRTPVLNDGIHPRNMYRTPPDFAALANQYTSLRPHVHISSKGAAVMQWSDPQAVKELTKALLHRDFGLTWDMPLNRLCPPLTNRLNYIHWIEDLILLSQPSYVSTIDSPIRGLDVGTGASCIYPLLGHALNQWHFVATDIDPASIECAATTIHANNLATAINLQLVDNSSSIFPPLSRPLLFTMCNPPFFDSIDEADTNPRTSCTGSALEMTTPGGEVAFIGRMIQESVALTTQVRWYTSLIGRKASLRPLLASLRAHGISNTRTTEFLQGRTTRWGIAWSFTDDGLATSDASYKVLGKRKEARRRQETAFRIPHLDQDPCGCASMVQVHARMLESPMLIHEMHVTIKREADDDDDAWNYKMTAADETKKVLWCGRAHVTSIGVDGFDISLAWQAGTARDLFWTFADKWKGVMLRSGRRWRKKAPVAIDDRVGEENRVAPEGSPLGAS